MSSGLPTGDQGQRYEVRCIWRATGEEKVLGWTEAADGGGLLAGARLWPSVERAWVVDRQAEIVQREVMTDADLTHEPRRSTGGGEAESPPLELPAGNYLISDADLRRGMYTTSDLLPCPLCDRPAISIAELVERTGNVVARVFCAPCGLMLSVCDKREREAEAREEAKRRWNSRAGAGGEALRRRFAAMAQEYDAERSEKAGGFRGAAVSLRFISPRGGLVFLVHPSTREPGRWQATALDGEEPVGHTTWDSAADAEASVCGRFVGGAAPVGDGSYQRERASAQRRLAAAQAAYVTLPEHVQAAIYEACRTGPGFCWCGVHTSDLMAPGGAEAAPRRTADAECPGLGRCHGAASWCPSCGALDRHCDAQECAQHRCSTCGAWLVYGDHGRACPACDGAAGVRAAVNDLARAIADAQARLESASRLLDST